MMHLISPLGPYRYFVLNVKQKFLFLSLHPWTNQRRKSRKDNQKIRKEERKEKRKKKKKRKERKRKKEKKERKKKEEKERKKEEKKRKKKKKKRILTSIVRSVQQKAEEGCDTYILIQKCIENTSGDQRSITKIYNDILYGIESNQKREEDGPPPPKKRKIQISDETLQSILCQLISLESDGDCWRDLQHKYIQMFPKLKWFFFFFFFFFSITNLLHIQNPHSFSFFVCLLFVYCFFVCVFVCLLLYCFVYLPLLFVFLFLIWCWLL